MKKILSLMLAALMLVSAIPTALATNDYSQGTQVVYTATGSESYTITVPAQLAPGGSGTVTLEGTWASDRAVTVTADQSVTLTNSINVSDTKTLDINFAGISEAGSNIESQTFTETVAVANIQNALFGTWSGTFEYNVNIGYAFEINGTWKTIEVAEDTHGWAVAAYYRVSNTACEMSEDNTEWIDICEATLLFGRPMIYKATQYRYSLYENGEEVAYGLPAENGVLSIYAVDDDGHHLIAKCELMPTV